MEEELKCKEYTYLLSFPEECKDYVEQNKEDLCSDTTVKSIYNDVCASENDENISEVNSENTTASSEPWSPSNIDLDREQVVNIILLLSIVLISVVGYFAYIIIRKVTDRKKQVHKLRIQFPNPNKEQHLEYRDAMKSFFNSIHKVLKNKRISLEIHKVSKKVELYITYTDKSIEDSLKAFLSSIEGIVLEDIPDEHDPMNDYGSLVSHRLVLTKNYYSIKLDHPNFYKVLIDYLASLDDSEQAGVIINIRPTNGKEGKINMELQKRDKELKDDKTNLEVYRNEKESLLAKADTNLFLVDIHTFGNSGRNRDGLSSIFSGLNNNKAQFSQKKGLDKESLKSRFINFEDVFTPLFRKHSGSYLNSSELALMIHPYHLERGKYRTNETVVLEAQPEFVEEQEDNTLIGQSVLKTGKHVNIYLPIENLDRHVYLAGSTGMGKSTVLIKLFLALTEKKKDASLVMFDPHGEDLLEIAYRIPDWSNVIYFNLAESTRTFTFNPLFSFNTSLKDKDNKAEQIYKIISEEAEKQNKDMGTSIQKLLKFLIQTAVHFPDAYCQYLQKIGKTQKEAEKIVKERQLTFSDFPYLLRRHSAYQDVLRVVFEDYQEDIALRWQTLEEWYTPNKAVLDGVENRLSFVVQDSIVDLLEATKFDINEAVRQNKIILMPLSEQSFGKISKKLITKFFLNELWTETQRITQKEDRSDVYVFIDEFQEAQLDIVDDLLAQARKYKIRLVLANQFLGQLWENVMKSVMGNVSTLFSFKVQNLSDAETITPLFKDKIAPEDINSLPKFSAYLRTLDTGGRDDVAFMSFKTINYKDEIGEVHSFKDLKKLNEDCLVKYGEERKTLKKLRLYRIKNPQSYFLDLEDPPEK